MCNQLEARSREYYNVFFWGHSGIGCTDVMRHSMDTGTAAPISLLLRKVFTLYQWKLQELLQQMLDSRVICPSTWEWAFPTVTLRRQFDKLHLCVNWCRLNYVAKKGSFPLPRINQTLYSLGDALYCNKLDLESGYWQVELLPDDRCRTAFTVPWGP